MFLALFIVSVLVVACFFLRNTPWSRRTSPGPMLRPPTPETSRTAPPTPVRELSDKDGEQARYSSTPLLDPAPTDWPPVQGDWRSEEGTGEEFHEENVDCSNQISESVLQKFRKSFSLRLNKKDGDISPPSTPPKEEHEKFRIGPLVWRSSKERRKKAARSTKCNSGDSGIHIEMAGSSESTDQPADTDESPPIVRRRCTGSSTDSRPSRPTSDFINQFLVDRLKAELVVRRSPGVRRTHSDLGGQRLYQWEVRRGYRRMCSHPSPIRSRPNRPVFRGAKGQYGKLRRSVSQPLGLNELSPVLVRKAQGFRTNSEDERCIGTSEDEALSDSESSLASLTDKKKSFDQIIKKRGGVLAEAVWDHVAMESEELGFRAGDVVTVIDNQDRDWWWGESAGRAGWFPSLFVRLKVGQTVEEQTALSRRLSETEFRTRVITELIATERDFVSVLTHLNDGYLVEARKRPDLLNDEEVTSIFSNLSQILEFQRSFLADLEASIDSTNTARSKIAPVFLKHLPGFRLYSEYCNCHAAAVATLEEVSRRNGVARFWEACRLMRGLMELPLSGYLLTPVQRICKYPLQLAELLKYTKTDHEDYVQLKEAVEGMKGVAFLINERKRRMESLEKVALWQRRVDAWEGEDLIERSCQLLHQGEAAQLKVSTMPGKWSHGVSLFLFDGQLIYCKKDILKRRTYVYKGRISLDSCEIKNLQDGKDSSLNCNIRHGIKLSTGDKWLVFTVRSGEEKNIWLAALDSERNAAAQNGDLTLPDSARDLARAAALRRHQNHSGGGKQRSKKRGKQREVGRWFRLGGRKHVFPS